MRSLTLSILLVLLVACSGTPAEVESTPVDTPQETTPNKTVQEEAEIVEENPRADLQPDSLAKTLFPDVDETTKLTVAVKNAGFGKTTKNTFNWKATLLFDGEVLMEKNGTHEGTLLASEDVGLEEFEYTFESVGTYDFTTVIDTENTVPESNEENNEKTIKLKVLPPGDGKETLSSSSSSSSSATGNETIDCTDSDGGKEEEKLGTCTDTNFPNGRRDFCSDDLRLREFVCFQNECDILTIECDNICRDGVCL